MGLYLRWEPPLVIDYGLCSDVDSISLMFVRHAILLFTFWIKLNMILGPQWEVKSQWGSPPGAYKN